MSNEWRNDLPPKEGFYEVKFGANDTPQIVYLHPFKAGEIAGIDEDFISWGYDESDDPESVEVECERNDFWWRENPANIVCSRQGAGCTIFGTSDYAPCG